MLLELLFGMYLPVGLYVSEPQSEWVNSVSKVPRTLKRVFSTVMAESSTSVPVLSTGMEAMLHVLETAADRDMVVRRCKSSQLSLGSRITALMSSFVVERIRGEAPSDP